jgi:hypothetical protein
MSDPLTLATWILGPVLGIYTLLFIVRIVLTWYPQAEHNRFPFNVAVWPTEFLLIPVRKVVPPHWRRRYFPHYLGGHYYPAAGSAAGAAGAIPHPGMRGCREKMYLL